MPNIISPQEFAARLRLADSEFPELLPFVAIGGLAGVRREEMLREYRDDEVLDWRDFLWNKRLVEIRPEVAKKTRRRVGDRRFIPIERALEHWLDPYKKESGPVVELSDSCSGSGWFFSWLRFNTQPIRTNYDTVSPVTRWLGAGKGSAGWRWPWGTLRV